MEVSIELFDVPWGPMKEYMAFAQKLLGENHGHPTSLTGALKNKLNSDGQRHQEEGTI